MIDVSFASKPRYAPERAELRVVSSHYGRGSAVSADGRWFRKRDPMKIKRIFLLHASAFEIAGRGMACALSEAGGVRSVHDVLTS
jgi:hypothetical protein